MHALLKDVRCSPIWEEDEEQSLWSIYIPELDTFGQGETREKAADDLMENVAEYVTLYMEDMSFYFKVDRQHHLPVVMALALCASPDEQKRILGI